MQPFSVHHITTGRFIAVDSVDGGAERVYLRLNLLCKHGHIPYAMYRYMTS